MERHTCRARTEGFGPWRRDENADGWLPGRVLWGWRQRFSSLLGRASWRWENIDRRGEYRPRPRRLLGFLPRLLGLLLGLRVYPIAGGGTRWPKEFPMPRRCTFCGGIHPEDAIRLTVMGWEGEGCDGGGKWYMHPPGFMDGFFSRSNPSAPKYDDPIPPVKLFGYHLDKDQAERLNSTVLFNNYMRRCARIKREVEDGVVQQPFAAADPSAPAQ